MKLLSFLLLISYQFSYTLTCDVAFSNWYEEYFSFSNYCNNKGIDEDRLYQKKKKIYSEENSCDYYRNQEYEDQINILESAKSKYREKLNTFKVEVCNGFSGSVVYLRACLSDVFNWISKSTSIEHQNKVASLTCKKFMGEVPEKNLHGKDVTFMDHFASGCLWSRWTINYKILRDNNKEESNDDLANNARIQAAIECQDILKK